MEPVIAHKIRENVFRNIIIWLDDLVNGAQVEPEIMIPEVPSDVRVTVVAPNAAVDMITNLWRRAKPVSVDDNALIPQPVMPKERDSNADTWIKVESQ
jgi:hypothetical protein